ncbi:MAG: phosphoribosylglycinamide formyltransferase [Acidobacteriota bacterium]|nr:phosphoribosylglycinamide formyltransferase [Acidobacteriota bacterium]
MPIVRAAATVPASRSRDWRLPERVTMPDDLEPQAMVKEISAKRTDGVNGAGERRPPRCRLAILLSGRGSNFEAIAEAIEAGRIPDAEIVAVISDVAEARGLAVARERGLPAFPVPRGDEARSAHEARILRTLEDARPDLLCLAGYMRVLSPGFVSRWRGRILNIHPSLLPRHSGLSPQKRALESGDAETGCTVHFVDEGVDSGPVVLQRRVPIRSGDTEETLSARILEREHEAYPEAIAKVLSDLRR